MKFTEDSNLDLTPLPRPPLPETREEVEARQLASELLGKPVDRGAWWRRYSRLLRFATVFPDH